MSQLDIQSIRADFPILGRKVYGRPLIYLDNTATSQTPRAVVDSVTDMYYNHKANVHRGVHCLSQEATDAMEATRESVRRFINASSTEEIIFTRGTTEAINLAAASYGSLLTEGDEIILTVMEHHSNIVPWQLLAGRKGLKIKVVPIDSTGRLDLDVYRSLFSDRTRVVAVTHISNVLGTVNPVATEQWCLSTALSPWLICGSTCRLSTLISMPFHLTRCTVRQASECSTASVSSSKKCLPTREAAR